MKKVLLGAGCAILLALSGGTIGAKIVYLNEDYVELRADKGGWSDPVITLHKGAAMQVLEGDGDDSTDYYKVSVTGPNGSPIQGYVFKSLVTDTQPSSSGWSQESGYYGNAEASQEGAAVAAKGLDGAVSGYINSNRTNFRAVQQMDLIPRNISSDEMHAFMRDGGVGVFQKRSPQGGGR